MLFQFLTAAVMVCFFGALVGLGGSLATAEPAGWRVIFTLTGIIIGYLLAVVTTPRRRGRLG